MASGQTLIAFEALDGIPPSTNFAPITDRNGHKVASFDDTTDETLWFTGVLPRNYGGAGITVRLAWMAASATANAVIWEVGFERHEDEGTDLDADSFATNQFASSTAPATSGAVQYLDIPFTNGAQIDSLAAGEHFRLRVTRDANGTNGTDSMTGDAQLLSVELRET